MDVTATLPLRRQDDGAFVGAMEGPDGPACSLRFILRDAAGAVLDSDELPPGVDRRGAGIGRDPALSCRIHPI